MEKVGYARTSKGEQNVSNQVELLLKEGCGRVYKDEGISGSKPATSRREFREMVAYLETVEKPVTLVVFELSRIGRNMIETLTLIKELEDSGIMVMSISPGEEFMNVEQKDVRNLILAIFSWLYERELKNISERTKAGLARARAEGKVLGRPQVEVTYDEIMEYRAKGLSHEKIARIFDCSTNTIYRIIDREGRKERGLA